MTAAASEYASAFAEFVGVRYSFPFWKGRVALYAILRALGIGRGDEVIVPGYTCVMNVNPILYLGAKPVYIDIEPNTFNLNPALLPNVITQRTRAVIAQHTYGFPAAMDDILSTAAKNGIPVVEDCCLALGAQYRGRRVGSLGVAAYYSFQWSKPYTTGLGGMAVTSDSLPADRIAQLRAAELLPPSAVDVVRLAVQLAAYRTFIFPRTTALATRLFRTLTRLGFAMGSSNASEYQPVMEKGFFKGMSRWQSTRGLRSLSRFDENVEHRRRLARLYDDLLSDRGWPRRVISSDVNPVLVRYPVRVADKQAALALAIRRGIELGSWFECPLHPQETPLAVYGYQSGQCPVAEEACRQVVNLPLHPRANERTVRRSVEFIARLGPPGTKSGESS